MSQLRSFRQHLLPLLIPALLALSACGPESPPVTGPSAPTGNLGQLTLLGSRPE